MPATLPDYRSSDPAAAEALHTLILASLDDDQAVDTISIPLAGKSSIADYMVIASGRSTRQVASMASKLSERIKRELGRPARTEGLPTADWVLIDAGDVIVHLFRPEVRSFYNLERMWSFGDAPAAPVEGFADDLASDELGEEELSDELDVDVDGTDVDGEPSKD